MEKINSIRQAVGVLLLLALASCTNYHYIDGGLANGKHDCTVWEYLHKQPYDWDSTLLMIEHAGMKEYFDGTKYKQITFFGITNLAIERFILDHDSDRKNTQKWNEVRGIPADSCAAILKKLILPEQRLMMDDFPRGRRDKQKADDGTLYYLNSGGADYDCVSGRVHCWTYRQDYEQVPEGGEVTLYMIREGMTYEGERIVSCNIEMTNGIVHALSYDFRLTNL